MKTLLEVLAVIRHVCAQLESTMVSVLISVVSALTFTEIVVTKLHHLQALIQA